MEVSFINNMSRNTLCFLLYVHANHASNIEQTEGTTNNNNENMLLFWGKAD